VEVHHAANHARFGPRAQRTTLADVLAVPGRRHEQWQCFAGYAGDKLVGAGAAITTRDNPHVGTMWLSVHPDHQGRGLGGALLAEIERDLRERGCTELLVHATETSDGGPPRLTSRPATGSATRHPPVPLLVRAAARPLRGGRRR
jgi:GNAT superfamily N-acetyltransferase